MFTVRNAILGAGVLTALICNLIVLNRISSIEEALDLNYHWMIVKKLRANEHQQRIERLEKIVNDMGQR